MNNLKKQLFQVTKGEAFPPSHYLNIKKSFINKNERGFALVELMVVITILAIIITLMVPRVVIKVEEARKGKEIENARVLASEITIYNMSSLSDASIWIIGNPISNSTDLSAIGGLPSGVDFPDTSVVTIHVDLNGIATVQILP